MELLDKIQFTTNFINDKIGDFKANFGLQLGTGMSSDFPDLIIMFEIPYADIPYFQTTTAPSHKGRMIFGTINDINVVILDGRYHYYEGYTMQEVVYPIYVLKYLNIDHLIVTNASGSVDPDIKTGNIVNITDHINLHHDNPLRGINNEMIGSRFPSMSQAYELTGSLLIQQCAKLLNLNIYNGIYMGLSGPNLETPAEYRMARVMGANIIGMSTIPEVIAANHCNLKVNAISIASNQFNDSNPGQETDVEEVIKVVKKNSRDLMRLLSLVIQSL